MIEGFDVGPSRLRLAGGKVRASGRQLTGAGRTVSRALDGVGTHCPGSLTAAAALGVAAAARTSVGSLVAGVEALAQALDAAAIRYADTDALVASIVGRQ